MNLSGSEPVPHVPMREAWEIGVCGYTKAILSLEGQQDDKMIEKVKRHEKEEVEFVKGSRNRTGCA